jgi:ABC-type nickel/cobalt efflux system permease component RcnA
MSSTTLVTIIHGVVAVSIIAAATTLLALSKIDATTAMALYTASLGVVGAATGTMLALKVPTSQGGSQGQP